MRLYVTGVRHRLSARVVSGKCGSGSSRSSSSRSSGGNGQSQNLFVRVKAAVCRHVVALQETKIARIIFVPSHTFALSSCFFLPQFGLSLFLGVGSVYGYTIYSMQKVRGKFTGDRLRPPISHIFATRFFHSTNSRAVTLSLIVPGIYNDRERNKTWRFSTIWTRRKKSDSRARINKYPLSKSTRNKQSTPAMRTKTPPGFRVVCEKGAPSMIAHWGHRTPGALGLVRVRSGIKNEPVPHLLLLQVAKRKTVVLLFLLF